MTVDDCGGGGGFAYLVSQWWRHFWTTPDGERIKVSHQARVKIKVKYYCHWKSYTILKSGDHKDSKYVNFKILAVKIFWNFTLNFEILDFEYFLFCEKVPQTSHTDAWKVSWKFVNFWLSYHENSTKISVGRFWPHYWL